MRMRRKKNLVPRLERCAQVTIDDPAALRGNWRSLFPAARALHLELGCGKGHFIRESARQNPDILYIAMEKDPSCIVMAMEKAQAENIPNVFFILGDAALLPEFFAPGEVDLIYINFCDPWTRKNKYAKRRLTHRNFIARYKQIIAVNGHLCMKTDNVPLFEFSVEEVPACGLELISVTRDLHATDIPNIMTEYEKRFSEQGLPINRLEAVFTETCLNTPIPGVDFDDEDDDDDDDETEVAENSTVTE